MIRVLYILHVRPAASIWSTHSPAGDNISWSSRSWRQCVLQRLSIMARQTGITGDSFLIEFIVKSSHGWKLPGKQMAIHRVNRQITDLHDRLLPVECILEGDFRI